jgi:hypothetical protein
MATCGGANVFWGGGEGGVFLNLENLILTHIMIFAKKNPNSPDFYNRFQQVAKIWKGFLNFSTFIPDL